MTKGFEIGKALPYEKHGREKRSLDIVWNELLKLTKETEQELEKDFSYLEKTTKKPREYHIKEAIIRYMENTEEIKEVEKYIKKNNLPHDYHITEALIRYVEDMEDIRDYIERKNKKNKKYYTSEELSKKLGL